MSKNLIFMVMFGLVAVLLMHTDAFAAGSTEKQIEQELVIKHNEIRSILFGPVAKIVAAVGALYGIVASFIGSTLRPLMVFGGIGLAASFAEKFINLIFGS